MSPAGGAYVPPCPVYIIGPGRSVFAKSARSNTFSKTQSQQCTFRTLVSITSTKFQIVKTVIGVLQDCIASHLSVVAVDVLLDERAQVLAHVRERVTLLVWLVGVDLESVLAARRQLHRDVHLQRQRRSSSRK